MVNESPPDGAVTPERSLPYGKLLETHARARRRVMCGDTGLSSALRREGAQFNFHSLAKASARTHARTTINSMNARLKFRSRDVRAEDVTSRPW